MADQNTLTTLRPDGTPLNRHSGLRSSFSSHVPKTTHNPEQDEDRSDSRSVNHLIEARENESVADPDYTSSGSSCLGDQLSDDDGEDGCQLVALFDDVDDIVAAASALAGPGDYFDLDQLPLLNPVNHAPASADAGNTGDPGTAKKRKRPTSIIEISDSEEESFVMPDPEFSDDADDFNEPAPKRRNQITSYTPNTRNLLRRGRQAFRESVLVTHAFPSQAARVTLGRESWEASRLSLPAASAASGTTMFDDDILQILTNVIWLTRASVKYQARDAVVDQYGLKNPARVALDMTPKAARAFNATHVKFLLKDYQYIYGSFGVHPDGTAREDVPFAHPSLFRLIYNAVYVHTSSVERARYDPMPLPLVALAATAMYAALDDWSTGKYVKRSFTTHGYGAHYERLLEGLKQFQALRPRRCAALIASYTAYCKKHDAEVSPADPELRVCHTDTEDDSA